MSGVKPLASPADVIYIYDGSFQGFLCCVFESVYCAEIPIDILLEEDAPLSLLETRLIATDIEKARRVHASIPAKISKAALELVETVFLSALGQKELKLLSFLLRAYREGGKLLYKLGDPVVAPLLEAKRHLGHEAHLLTGFIRFSDVGGALYAEITPKNYVLPFIAKHFILRYSDEDFMILDKTHQDALVYNKGESQIIKVEDITLHEVSEKEKLYQSLWKRFYKTVSIEGRENPRCRMSLMPKRYWENMLEVKELLE